MIADAFLVGTAAGYALMAAWLLAARWLTVETEAGH
jgi:hypothetical protein